MPKVDAGAIFDFATGLVEAVAPIGTAAVTGKYNAQTAAALGMYGQAGGGSAGGGISPIVIQTGGAAQQQPQQQKSASAGMPVWGWVAIAVGVAALVAGAVFVLRKKK